MNRSSQRACSMDSVQLEPQARRASRTRLAADPLPASSEAGEELSGTQPLRVLCVDDHAVLVEGLKARFAIDGGIKVVGRLATASRLADEVGRLRPDVVILDVEMPGPDAFEMTVRVRADHPEVRVMVLSAHIRDAIISAAFRAGICAYFAKSDELSDIVRGIHEVARSRSASFLLGPKVRELCRPDSSNPKGASAGGDTDERPRNPGTRLASLTAREREILRLIGKGLSRTQIAAQLCRSAKTVDAHQGRMMKKLDTAARADLMRLAIREGLAEA